MVAVRATQIRALGPFELEHDGHVVSVGGPVGQAILTALAHRPDTKVLPAQLITLVWGDPDVVNVDTLYHHVTRLRQVLATVGLDIIGHRPGYRLPIAAEQVDVARFDELLRTARALTSTDPDQAAERLRAALALWRAPQAVDNITLPGIRRLAAGWEARRLDAEEDLAEIDLSRGKPEQVLDRLHTLAAANPDRPRLTAALARALHATGRTEQATTLLAGTDPALVTARRELSIREPPARHDPVVPFQLPADTVRFTGRTEHLAHLLDLSPDQSTSPATVVVTAVEGMAGIGKTALAVHAAHALADRFADGVLFSDLHGFTPEAEPTPPEQILDQLLRGLGIPQVPPDLAARVGLYRSVLARRQVLIVLDNAADENQLGPLLPSAPGCRVIITSRRHLAGLDDATHLTLAVLDPIEAAELFRGLAGDRVTHGDHQTVEQIVALCGRLPLAMRIAAARLRLAPAGTPTTLCAELTNALGTGRGLDWLSDGHRAVGAALAVSYQHLTDDQQRVFRLTGLHPGHSIEPYAMAALADTTVDSAARLLDDLYAASLIDQPSHRRYTQHDLVAAYATTLATEMSGKQTALNRLYDHYAATSSRAMNLSHPWELDRRPNPPATHTPMPTLSTEQDAQAWLDTETDNLLAAAQHSAAQHTLHQSATLDRHLTARGRYSAAVLLHQQALTIARQTGNQNTEAVALIRLALAHRVQGRREQATDCFEQALAVARHIGNLNAEAEALIGLAVAHRLRGGDSPTFDFLDQALAITRQTGNRDTEAEALISLGAAHRLQARLGTAADYFEQALAIIRQTGNRNTEHKALNNLASVHAMQGRPAAALDCFEQALAIARQIGNLNAESEALIGLGALNYMEGRHADAVDRLEQALALTHHIGNLNAHLEALIGLGAVHNTQARHAHALDRYQQALDIGREIGNRNGQFEAHHGIGRAHHATGDHQGALHRHRDALELAVDLDQAPDQARAHDGLAHAQLALGNTGQARHHWQTALSLLTGVGTDHTDEPDVTTEAIRGHLHGLDDHATAG